MARRVVAKLAQGGGSPAPLDQRVLVDAYQTPPPAPVPEWNGDMRAVPESVGRAWAKEQSAGMGKGADGKLVLCPGELHGFCEIAVEQLPGGAVVRWFANEQARYLVVVDELRIQAGAGVPKGALVFIEPGEETTQEQVDAAERAAVELGAAAVRKLPVREKGTGAAPEAAPAGADVTLREAVDQALAKLPADVREGARRRADAFLSAEKV